MNTSSPDSIKMNAKGKLAGESFSSLPGLKNLPSGASVLVVLLGRIGDVVMTLPAVLGLKEARPDLSIDWVVEDRCSDLLVGHPALRHLILFHRKDFEEDFRKGFYQKAWSNIKTLYRDLRRERYAAVLDFQALLKSGVITFLSRGAIKLGSPSTYGRMKEASWLFSKSVPLADPSLHLVDRHRLVIRELLGQDPPKAPFVLGISPREEWTVTERLDRWNEAIRREIPEENGDGAVPPNRKLALLHPFASWVTRRWPIEYFGIVARDLIREGFRVGVIGGGGADQEVAFLKIREALSMDSGLDGAFSICLKAFSGDLTLKESSVLMTKADIVIACDSGPMHLASALGLPTVGIFGPTDPVRLGPVGPYGISVDAGLLCHPCMGRRCPIGIPCMRELTPEMVMEKARFLLRLSEESSAPLLERF